MEHHPSLKNVNLSDNEKKILSTCLVKISAQQHLPSNEAQNGLNSLSRLGTVNDNRLCQDFVMILAAKYNATREEKECLQEINKNRQTINNLSHPKFYATIMKLMKKLEHDIYKVLKFSSNLHQFFTSVKQDQNFQKLLELTKQLQLSDEQSTELLKAEYRPQDFNNHHRDELIRKLDERRKLAELPAKSFATLMNHIGKKLQLDDQTIQKHLMPLERTLGFNESKKTHVDALFHVIKSQYNIQPLPKQSREALQAKWQILQQNNMIEYVQKLKAPTPHSQEKMARYEKLLISIAQGNNPNDSQLAMLDSLHREFFGDTIPDAMPNRSQAYLENYRTQREIKKKLPSNTNITELFKRLDNNQEFKPMEVAYFFFHLQKNDITLPPPEQARFGNFLTKYSELAKITKQQTELIDPKALKLINQVIDQIIYEQRPGYHDGQKILVPSLNASISRTSNFMEIRFKVKELLDNFSDDDLKKFIKNPQNIDKTKFFKNHEGVDFSGLGNKNGEIRYISGFTRAVKIAKILEVKNSWTNGRATKDISIVEYHPSHGVLVTIFRHTQLGNIVNALRSGQDLKHNQLIGTYKIADSDKDENEHAHIERRSSNVNSVSKFTAQTLENKFNALAPDTNNAKAIQEIQAKTKLVQPIIEGNEYHTIALFTPGSKLNSEFLRQVEKDWIQNTVHSIEVQKIKTLEDLLPFLKTLNDGAFKDHLLLEHLVKILTRVKSLLAQVGERNDGLERTMQKAQHTAINLREKYVPKQIKIVT